MSPLVTRTNPPTSKRRVGGSALELSGSGAFLFVKGLRVHGGIFFSAPKSSNPNRP